MSITPGANRPVMEACGGMHLYTVLRNILLKYGEQERDNAGNVTGRGLVINEDLVWPRGWPDGRKEKSVFWNAVGGLRVNGYEAAVISLDIPRTLFIGAEEMFRLNAVED